MAALAFLVLAAVYLIQREVRDRTAKQHAYPVVAELGGTIGSLTPPVPFAGSEIRISFKGQKLTTEQLDRLAILSPLTEYNSVGVMFQDTNLSAEDIRRLRGLLPKCRVFRVVGGQRQNDP